MRTFIILLYLLCATIVMGAEDGSSFAGKQLKEDSINLPNTAKYTSDKSDDNKEGHLRITDLIVNGKNFIPQDTIKIYTPVGVVVGKATLKPSQNSFTIKFEDTETKKNSRSQVEYILRGYDKDFIRADSVKSVTYSNLPAGHYNFVVRRVIGVYRGVQEYTRLDIDIRPPFYATHFAMFVYFLIVAFTIFTLLRLYDLRRLALDRLKLEQRDHQREKEYNQAILRFFTNVSHELRTPLTIISGQLEHILESDSLDPTIYRRTMSAFTSTSKLQSLVDELLDLRKQQSGYATLNLQCVDMAEITKEIYVNYIELAADRGLRYRLFIEECDGIYAMADRVEIEKVIFNLLSNAFKFTNEGSVEVSLSCEGESVVLTVRDSGKGIDEENQHKIFEQYYQEERRDDFDSSIRGTGIGLALVNHIVASHSGTIEVESKLGEGSCFTVKLPRTDGVVDQVEAKESATQPDVVDVLIDRHRGVDVNKLILIVEDNDMMREFLNDVLSKYYRVELATDGQEGYDKAKALLPTLILSDVMMPNISGTQMCTMLKAEPKTSHIPIILLTAKVAMEHKIQGLALGADDYITKPFSIKLLISRIDNILKSREALMNRFMSDSNLSSYKRVATKLPKQEGGEASAVIENIMVNNPIGDNSDEEFLSQAYLKVVDNVSNSTYSVDQFAGDMGVGRTKFFQILKRSIDMTPNDFILMVRLKRAIEMLSGDANISMAEVAEMCGFSSQQYFSSCFKRKFDMTPNQYLAKERERLNSTMQNNINK